MGMVNMYRYFDQAGVPGVRSLQAYAQQDDKSRSNKVCC